MNKNILFLIALLIVISSCSSTKVTSNPSSSASTHHSQLAPKVQKLLTTAESYLGTPYRYGGESRSGMDCSGFVDVAFSSIGLQLPRVSREQAKAGKAISLRHVVPGDLLFFTTSGSRINHVGIVHHIEHGTIFFIHASTSRGVIISSLSNAYWQKAFKTARRVL